MGDFGTLLAWHIKNMEIKKNYFFGIIFNIFNFNFILFLIMAFFLLPFFCFFGVDF